MIGLVGKNMRNGRRQKANHLFIKCLLQKFFVFSIITILLLGPAFNRPFIVEASISGTLAGLITTLVLSLGISPTGTAYMDAINNAGFQNISIEEVANGTYSASQIDAAIQAQGVDLSSITDVLSNTSSEGAALSSAGGLSGSAALGGASAGQNIAASAQAYQETGTILPSVGGQALGQFNGTGALLPIFYNMSYTSEKLQKMDQLINSGLFQNDVKRDILSNIPAGNRMVNFDKGEWGNWYNYTYDYNQDINFFYYITKNYGNGNYEIRYKLVSKNADSRNCIAHIVSPNGSTRTNNVTIGQHGNSYYNEEYIDIRGQFGGGILCQNEQDWNNKINNFVNNGTVDFKSPDINTNDGNAVSNYDNTNNIYITPSFNPIINYNVDGSSVNKQYIVNPVDWNNYQNYADTVNTNTENKNYENNGQEFQNLIQTIKGEKETGIFDPTASTDPYVPVQPTQAPKPTLTPEQETENVETMATVDLKDVFPFCIPWDLYAMMTKFEMGRQAPQFHFSLDLGPAGVHNIDIDFSEFEEVAALARALELIVFIVGLAIASRKLIGA